MCLYGAAVIFKLLKSHDPGVQTQQSCRHSVATDTDEAEEPEPEHKERTKMVLKFCEGLGLIEAGINDFEDIDWNEQRAATTRWEITRISGCCQEIVKEKRFLSCHVSVLYFFKLSSGTRASPSVLEVIQMTCLKFCKKCLSLNQHLFVMFNVIVHSLMYKYIFTFWSKQVI
jgi:hypothetical protein